MLNRIRIKSREVQGRTQHTRKAVKKRYGSCSFIQAWRRCLIYKLCCNQSEDYKTFSSFSKKLEEVVDCQKVYQAELEVCCIICRSSGSCQSYSCSASSCEIISSVSLQHLSASVFQAFSYLPAELVGVPLPRSSLNPFPRRQPFPLVLVLRGASFLLSIFVFFPTAQTHFVLGSFCLFWSL